MKLAVVLALLLCFTLCSADTTYMVQFKWTVPTYGSPVEHYVVQLKADSLGTWTTACSAPDTTCSVPCTIGKLNWVRVAGVDSIGRQGLFSDSSLPVDLRTSGVPMDGTYPEPVVAKSTGCFRGRTK